MAMRTSSLLMPIKDWLRLRRNLDVAFDDERQFLQFALLDLVEQVVEGNLGIDVEFGRTFLFHSFFGNGTSRLFVGDVQDVAGFRYVVEAEDFDGQGRFRFLDPFASFVVHGTNFPEGRADDDRIADAQGALLNEDGCDRTAAFIELGFDDDTLSRAVRIGFEILYFCQDEDVFEEFVEADFLMCRNGNHDGIAAPVFTDEAVFGQLLHDVFRVGTFFIDLIDGDDDRYACRFGMVDGFNRLRHDAVVSGNDQDGNIRNLGAAGTHGCKGFVARRIHEGDLLAFVTDLVSTDVLRNAAGFVAGDIGLTDGVEETRLAVVDVTHDGDDRRTSFQGFRCIDDFFDFRRIFRRGFHGNGDAEFVGNQRSGIEVEFLVDGSMMPPMRSFFMTSPTSRPIRSAKSLTIIVSGSSTDVG